MFAIAANVAHVFTYLEDSALISLYDKGVELSENEMDIHKVSTEDFSGLNSKEVTDRCI